MQKHPIVLYDPFFNGHHTVYARYLAEYLCTKGENVILFIGDFRMDSALARNLEYKHPLFNLKFMPPVIKKETIFFKIKRQSKELKKIQNICRQFQPKAFIHLFFDDIMLILGLRGLLNAGLSDVRTPFWGGIYFHPYFMRPQRENFSKREIRFFFEKIAFYSLLSKGGVNALYLLDESLARKFQQWPKKHREINIHLCPDPWDGNFDISVKEARQKLNIPEDKFVLLSFGLHGYRKGVDLVVGALEKLDSNTLNSLVLLVSGPLKPHVKNYLLNKYKADAWLQERLMVFDRTITDSESVYHFCASDCVLLPYRNFIGSSNVLIRACAAGKPAITGPGGLIYEQVKKYNLGYCVESLTSSDIANMIYRVINEPESTFIRFKRNNKQWAQRHHKRQFGETFLSAIRAQSPV